MKRGKEKDSDGSSLRSVVSSGRHLVRKISKSLHHGHVRSTHDHAVSGSPVVFGVALEETACNGVIPYVIVKCVQFIEMYGLHDEGVYRKNGDLRSVKLIKQSFDKTGDATFEGPGDWVAVAASVLKLYLRELPEPLIPEEFHGRLFEILCHYRKAQSSLNGLDTDTEQTRLVVDLQRTFDCISLPHLNTLQFLCEHLQHVYQNAEVNKMGGPQLGTVFAPSFFGISASMNVGDVGQLGAQLIDCLVQFHQRIFVAPSQENLHWTRSYSSAGRKGSLTRSVSAERSLSAMTTEEALRSVGARRGSVDNVDTKLLTGESSVGSLVEPKLLKQSFTQSEGDIFSRVREPLSQNKLQSNSQTSLQSAETVHSCISSEPSSGRTSPMNPTDHVHGKGDIAELSWPGASLSPSVSVMSIEQPMYSHEEIGFKSPQTNPSSPVTPARSISLHHTKSPSAPSTPSRQLQNVHTFIAMGMRSFIWDDPLSTSMKIGANGACPPITSPSSFSSPATFTNVASIDIFPLTRDEVPDHTDTSTTDRSTELRDSKWSSYPSTTIFSSLEVNTDPASRSASTPRWPPFNMKLSAEEILCEATRRIDDDRQINNRPTDLKLMSADEIAVEKLTLKAILRDFDVDFEHQRGVAPSKTDKEMLRPLYQRYHEIKNCLQESNTSRRLTPHVNPPSHSSAMVVAAANRDGSANEEFRAIKARKKQLQVLLRAYEADFFEKHGRKVSVLSDRLNMMDAYLEYQVLKRKLTHYQLGSLNETV